MTGGGGYHCIVLQILQSAIDNLYNSTSVECNAPFLNLWCGSNTAENKLVIRENRLSWIGGFIGQMCSPPFPDSSSQGTQTDRSPVRLCHNNNWLYHVFLVQKDLLPNAEIQINTVILEASVKNDEMKLFKWNF